MFPDKTPFRRTYFLILILALLALCVLIVAAQGGGLEAAGIDTDKDVYALYSESQIRVTIKPEGTLMNLSLIGPDRGILDLTQEYRSYGGFPVSMLDQTGAYTLSADLALGNETKQVTTSFKVAGGQIRGDAGVPAETISGEPTTLNVSFANIGDLPIVAKAMFILQSWHNPLNVFSLFSTPDITLSPHTSVPIMTRPADWPDLENGTS